VSRTRHVRVIATLCQRGDRKVVEATRGRAWAGSACVVLGQGSLCHRGTGHVKDGLEFRRDSYGSRRWCAEKCSCLRSSSWRHGAPAPASLRENLRPAPFGHTPAGALDARPIPLLPTRPFHPVQPDRPPRPGLLSRTPKDSSPGAPLLTRVGWWFAGARHRRWTGAMWLAACCHGQLIPARCEQSLPLPSGRSVHASLDAPTPRCGREVRNAAPPCPIYPASSACVPCLRRARPPSLGPAGRDRGPFGKSMRRPSSVNEDARAGGTRLEGVCRRPNAASHCKVGTLRWLCSSNAIRSPRSSFRSGSTLVKPLSGTTIRSLLGTVGTRSASIVMSYRLSIPSADPIRLKPAPAGRQGMPCVRARFIAGLVVKK
jgi:hypothetical protein